MFGYACMETEEFDELQGRFFPLAAALFATIDTKDDQCANGWHITMLDQTQSQITIEYDNGIQSEFTQSLLQSNDKNLKDRFGGSEEEELAFVREEIRKHVVEHAIPENLMRNHIIW